jgi:hypothetical protein
VCIPRRECYTPKSKQEPEVLDADESKRWTARQRRIGEASKLGLSRHVDTRVRSARGSQHERGRDRGPEPGWWFARYGCNSGAQRKE